VIASVADPGTTVHVQGLTEAAGIGGAHYRFLEYHDMKEVLSNAVKAEHEGYDAFLIGNITDAGIREARELVNIPVLGLSETSLHMASIMGTTFGLVAISERWIPRLLENVQRYGFERLLVGIDTTDVSTLEMRKAFGNEQLSESVVAAFTAAADRLLAKGAEVIIPAGGEIVVFLAQAGIYELHRAPILNGIFELIKMGEMAVQLRALTGRFTSKRGRYAPPTGELLEKARAFYGADIYPGAK
jgi:Asp/Glu/hydantoin racemase